MAPSVASFADLLQSAVTEPGAIQTAYQQFHTYSLGNQLLAWSQCLARSLQPGPMATFPKWKELGRYVRKGEKAIVLCQPVTVKRTIEEQDGIQDDATFTRFVYRPHWFVLAQTDGQALEPMPIPSWDRAKALDALSVTEVPISLRGFSTP